LEVAQGAGACGVIDWSGFAFPKGTPRVLVKETKDRDKAAHERRVRIEVNQRDNYACFWPKCKTRASDRHHIRPKSLLGPFESWNLLSACRKHHDYFKAGLVAVTGDPDVKGSLHVSLTQMGIDAKLRLIT
jgi:hypothetical protein